MGAAEKLDQTLCSKPVAKLLRLPREARIQVVRSMPEAMLRRLLWAWEFWGRPDQVWRPGAEMHTLYLAGRGWGKTRTGAEAVRYVAENPQLCGGRASKGPEDESCGEGGVIAIAGRTANDVNQTMIYGPSGIMAVCPPSFRPHHAKSDKLLIFPNGVRARLMSGDVPDSFRGPNFGFLWADELAHWARAEDSWTQAKLALRHGRTPRSVVTTTPLGTEMIKALVYELIEGDFVAATERPDRANDGRYAYASNVRVVLGSTYDNAANLARNFMLETVGGFEGSDLADQELRGAILFEIPNAIWSRSTIRRCNVEDVPGVEVSPVLDAHGDPVVSRVAGDLTIVLGIDPTVSDDERSKSDKRVECGLVVVAYNSKGRAWVLDDASGSMSTARWAQEAARLCDLWGVDVIAVEDNQGGELVQTNLQTHAPRLPVEIVRVRASRNKGERAALVAPLWSASRVWHVGSPRRFVRLEHQMTQYDRRKPDHTQQSDRMDALVWAMLYAFNDGKDRGRIQALGNKDVWRRVQEEIQRRRLG